MFAKLLNLVRVSALWILLLPYGVYTLGAASNQAVLIANHDTFPVLVNDTKLADFRKPAKVVSLDDILGPPMRPQPSPVDDGMIDDVHCRMTSKTHLNFLADIFDLKSEGIYSIGDFLIMLSEWLSTFTFYVWGFSVIRKLQKQQ